ncbi:MAG: hypothetical protein WCN81_00130 [Actinomycetes bacterium]
MAKNLSNTKIVNALDYASGTADRTGAIIDMAGWTGVLMIVKFATIAASAVTSIKAQQDTDVAGGTMADLLGTGITVADDDDNQIFCLNLVKPEKRYVRLYVDKDAAHAAAESAYYILYGPHGIAEPTLANVTDAFTLETHTTPAEGTA